MWLHPKDAIGVEALCYLPAFNAEIRELYEKKGFVLLNRVDGALDRKNLRIEPPTNATIAWVVETLRDRLAAEYAATEAELKRTERAIRRTRKEDILNQQEERLEQLKDRLATLERDLPTFKTLKTFFVRVHEAHLKSSVDANLQDVVNAIIANQRWAESARRDLEGIGDDGEPSGPKATSAAKPKAKAGPAVKDPDEAAD
jgi:hypothetical protein